MRDHLIEAEKAAAKTPEAAAQENMRPPLPRRFYNEVTVSEDEEGFSVLLDGRQVKTPAKSKLILPSKAAAELLADEWRSQETEINPAKMHATRLANTAIDGIVNETQAVLEDIVRFASNDLLFYRATHPEKLVENQRAHWDPILDWYADELGARFETTDAILHIAQPKEAITLFSSRLGDHADPIELSCLHTMTSLTGSALIALARANNSITLEEAWAAAYVDEDFNISQWGEDYEAGKRREIRFAEMKAADTLFRAL